MTRFLKVKEVCELFGVSRYTIRNWVEKGKFTAPIKYGLYLRWPEEDIKALVERLKRNRWEEKLE